MATLFSSNPSNQSSSRLPRAAIKINGTRVAGITQVSVTNNRYREADTFDMTLSIASLPDQYDVNFWASASDIVIEVLMGIVDPASGTGIGQTELEGLTTLVTGLVDECEIVWEQNLVRVRGRDYTSLMIDSTIEGMFSGTTGVVTASKIVEMIVAKHPEITGNITQTTENVGSVHVNKYMYRSSLQSEWDLLCFLADVEDFSVSVTGTVLTFAKRIPGDTYNVVYQASPRSGLAPMSGNFIRLSTKHRKTLTGTISVHGKSWDHAKQKTIESNKSLSVGGSSKFLRYALRGKRIDKVQMDKRATSALIQAVLHEKSLVIELPGDMELSVDKMLSLRGTGTAFDQQYYVDKIDRVMEFNSGFTMTAWCKNTSKFSESQDLESIIEDLGPDPVEGDDTQLDDEVSTK